MDESEKEAYTNHDILQIVQRNHLGLSISHFFHIIRKSELNTRFVDDISTSGRKLLACLKI